MNTKKRKTPAAGPTKDEILARDISDVENKIKLGRIPTDPTRRFNVGDPVRVGALENAFVTHVIQDGLGYVIHYDYMQEESRDPHKVGDIVCPWVDVFPVLSKFPPRLSIKDDMRLDFYNSCVELLLNRIYAGSMGVDFDPPYQRGIAWTLEQKRMLIQSIFNKVDIGKFTFNKSRNKPFLSPWFEIVDGKQRLMALRDFYEDRFDYEGVRFSELCPADRYAFESHNVSIGDLDNATEEQVLRLFVKLNTCGTPMDPSHIEKVRKMIPE